MMNEGREPMTTEPQYPQPKPSHDFRILLAALGKYLSVNTSIPVREVCPDGLAWVLESAFGQWVDGRVDDKLNDVYDEMGAISECVLANRAKLLEAEVGDEQEAAGQAEELVFALSRAQQQQREA